jgi:anti-sigma regulatory factor (Ser/Thr protein kinase)
MTVATSLTETFFHPALLYRGAEEYLAGTVPFVREGLAAGEPVAVAVPGANLELLRGALSEDGAQVLFIDMSRAGRNPGRIIPGVLRDFADEHPDQHVRIIGEPIWPGRSTLEYPACAQHEALINYAFAERLATILCPYDLEGLDGAVIEDACRTHPTLIDADGPRSSAVYAPDHIVTAYNLPLPPPPDAAMFEVPGEACLPEARDFAARQARHHGLSDDRVEDLVLAVAELTTNSVEHGGGRGTLRIWREDEHLVCQVTDSGHITDPLAGRHPASLERTRGHGLLLVNHVADLTRLHTTPEGTTIRILLRLAAE